MPRETPSPIDLPDDPVPEAGLGWTTTVIAIATIFLLAGNAVSLRDWAEDLPPSPAQARLAALADDWVMITETTVGAPRAWLHVKWKQAEALRFGGKPADG